MAGYSLVTERKHVWEERQRTRRKCVKEATRHIKQAQLYIDAGFRDEVVQARLDMASEALSELDY